MLFLIDILNFRALLVQSAQQITKYDPDLTQLSQFPEGRLFRG
jgi:hypothetical protein